MEVHRDKNDINAYFTIEDLRIGKASYVPLRDRVEQEIAESGFWQINSEYQEAPWQSVDTYFVLVVDGSRSLDGKNHDQNGQVLICYPCIQERTDLLFMQVCSLL